MSKDFFRREWLIWLSMLIPFIYILYIWNQLPDVVPTHFNIKGEPDAYGSKAMGTLILPCINLFIYFTLLFIPRFDPRYNHYEKFQKAYYAIRLVIHIFLSLLALAIVYIAMTGSMFSLRFIPVFAFLMIAMLGYFMRTVKSNFFVGIRTPWTLSNEEVWKQTHEFGGKVMFYTGIITCLLLFVMPMKYVLWIIFPSITIIAIVPIVYSYLKFRELKQKERE